MNVLAALAGGVAAAGLLLLIRAFTYRRPPEGRPPRRRLRARGFAGASLWRILAATGAGLAVLLISGWPVAGIATAAAVIFVPRVTTVKAQRRRIAVLEGLDQWTRRVRDLLTAGRALEDALEASAVSPPAAIASPVTTLARRLSARTGADAALRAFAAEIGDPAADRIAAALIIATSARGGGVRNVLSALADLLARDVAARRQAEADRAQHRTTLRWITGFLFAYSIFALVNRSYSAPFGTLAGQAVLAAVAGLYAAGLAWLHHLGTTPARGRFLDAPEEGSGGADGTALAGRPR